MWALNLVTNCCVCSTKHKQHLQIEKRKDVFVCWQIMFEYSKGMFMCWQIMFECQKSCLYLCVQKNCVLTFSLIVAKFWLLLSNELFRLSLATGCIFWKDRAGKKYSFWHHYLLKIDCAENVKWIDLNLIQCSNVWRYFAVFYISHFLCFHYISEELGYYADLKIRKFRQCHVSKKKLERFWLYSI